MTNIIPVAFNGAKHTEVLQKWQYDYGRQIEFVDIELPESSEIHMCNKGGTSAKRSLIVDGIADLYDEYFLTGKDIEIYVYVHPETGTGQTEYTITIPAVKRPPMTNAQPTPVQQDIIEQTIEQLGRDADRAEAAAGQSEGFSEDSEAWAKGTRAGEPIEDTDPTYHNNSKYWSEESERLGAIQAENAEAWAKGTRDSEPVESTDPAYHNNSKYWSEESERLGTIQAENAEAWANGTRDGSPVPSTDPAYQNNAKYWEGLAEQCAESAGFAWADIDEEDGNLYFYVSDDLEDGLEFEINEETGILEVTFL